MYWVSSEVYPSRGGLILVKRGFSLLTTKINPPLLRRGIFREKRERRNENIWTVMEDLKGKKKA